MKQSVTVRSGGEAIVVLVTVSSREEGERIARRLVEGGLAACVNLLPSVRSFFIWENKLSEAEELLLVIKSERARLPEVAEAVTELHSYTVPEVIALPILEGAATY